MRVCSFKQHACTCKTWHVKHEEDAVGDALTKSHWQMQRMHDPRCQDFI